ncbi:MAG: hypothetical protein NVSMB48_26000 [Marmoricola sp.]
MTHHPAFVPGSGTIDRQIRRHRIGKGWSGLECAHVTTVEGSTIFVDPAATNCRVRRDLVVRPNPKQSERRLSNCPKRIVPVIGRTIPPRKMNGTDSLGSLERRSAEVYPLR